MPTSSPVNISRIVEFCLALNPSSVLDIGVGNGKYGFLLREYLDILLHSDGTSWPPPRVTRIDGIEACAKYLGPVQQTVYDRIFEGNALEILPTLADHSYDLILMIDVLEHFSAADALTLMTEAKRAGTHILAVTPAGDSPQEDSYGNEYERHRMSATRRGLHRLGFTSVHRTFNSYFASFPAARFLGLRWRAEHYARFLYSKVKVATEGGLAC